MKQYQNKCVVCEKSVKPDEGRLILTAKSVRLIHFTCMGTWVDWNTWYDDSVSTERITIDYDVVGKGSLIYHWCEKEDTDWDIIRENISIGENIKLIIKKITYKNIHLFYKYKHEHRDTKCQTNHYFIQQCQIPRTNYDTIRQRSTI